MSSGMAWVGRCFENRSKIEPASVCQLCHEDFWVIPMVMRLTVALKVLTQIISLHQHVTQKPKQQAWHKDNN